MSVQKAIFPGIIAGIICLILMTSLLASTPGKAYAGTTDPATSEQAAPAANNNSEHVVEQKAAATNNTQVECAISSSFPESIQQWCGSIERYARQNGLDPNLVSAVMLQESAGKADAYSKSGAVGLLQVMPRDGIASSFTCPNGPCFANRPSIQELMDPEYNIAYGTQMLAGLLSRYGDIREALKAYGPKDVGYYYADIVLGIFNNHQ
jgi:soluble lytic murein transglycosylase-like protein